MSKNYHFIVFEQNDMFRSQTIEELLRERANYYTDKKTLKKLKDNDQIIFSYCNENGDITKESNPNGSLLNIAGITNKKGNVIGLMPHPERVSEKVFNNTDGIKFFKSVVNYHNY